MALERTDARTIIAVVALCFGWPGCVVEARAQEPAFDPERLLADVRTYYGFGVHRTAHPGDVRTSAWLAERFRTLGLETSSHAFALRQFFLDEASVRDERGEIEAFPVWLPRATPAEGVTGRLVLVGESTPADRIRGAVAWLQPGVPAAARARLDRKALEAGAAAILVETSDGAGLGLLQAINAERAYVDVERPVPTLIYGAADTPRLRQSIDRDVTVLLRGRMVEEARATTTYATHVVDPEADWIVVSTPSSGWFTVAGERGPGIAMLLALAEWVSTRRDGLNYLFVATSGHELDYLGARLFHEAQLAPPPERTRAWVHLGAQIATPPWEEVDGRLLPTDRVTTGTLQATEELAPALRQAFAHLPTFTLRTDTRIGEFRDLVEHGYRGMGIVSGSNPWFHVPGDDPRGVHGGTLAAVTAAMALALLAVEGMGGRE
ncbi:MAG: hypothetical protein FJ207_07045 [Gemmatimonadetes bacterium]|nr:hypothetical protein [Gemmatimonadota bacterium]